MPRIDNVLLLVCLLLLVAFSGHIEAAKTGSEDPFLVLPPGLRPEEGQSRQPKDLGEKVFTLRHIYHHGTHDYPNLHRYKDIPKNAQLYVTADDGETKLPADSRLHARAMSTNMQRMVDRNRSTIDRLLNYAGDYGHAMSLPASAWSDDEIPGPNVTDRSTVITFAKMAYNAYTEEPFGPSWEPVKGGFNYTDDFGWQQDGLRGHVFADESNRTIVIGLKGTTMAVFDGADTTGNDKLNDNLFASCCCGQGGHWTWKQVCDCKGDGYTCNSTCVRQALNKKSHYYWAAKDLYHNVTERYPNADVWFSGHSLGGVVSTLIGLTFGLPVITFEAYPDALAASRLGLPTPPGYRIGAHQARPDTGIHHFGHTADPVYMGSCGTAGSLCTIGGYAFESYCHTGKTCTYDTVSDFGWRSSVVNHKIISVIENVLKVYDTVANCTTNPDCQDCYAWNFFESNGTEPITSTTSSSSAERTRTRTETCLTPGWFGCLDETTTSSGMSTTSTTTTTTSESTTTTTSSSDSSSSSSSSSSSDSISSTTCETPGWFGCKDSTTTTSSSTTSSTTASPAPTVTTTSSLPTSTSTCKTPGFFGCNDVTSTTATSSAPPSSTASESVPRETGKTTAKRRTCVKRNWYGGCKQWGEEAAEPRGDL